MKQELEYLKDNSGWTGTHSLVSCHTTFLQTLNNAAFIWTCFSVWYETLCGNWSVISSHVKMSLNLSQGYFLHSHIDLDWKYQEPQLAWPKQRECLTHTQVQDTAVKQCQISTQGHMSRLTVQKVEKQGTFIKSELCFTTSPVMTNN